MTSWPKAGAAFRRHGISIIADYYSKLCVVHQSIRNSAFADVQMAEWTSLCREATAPNDAHTARAERATAAATPTPPGAPRFRWPATTSPMWPWPWLGAQMLASSDARGAAAVPAHGPGGEAGLGCRRSALCRMKDKWSWVTIFATPARPRRRRPPRPWPEIAGQRHRRGTPRPPHPPAEATQRRAYAIEFLRRNPEASTCMTRVGASHPIATTMPACACLWDG